MPTKTKRHSSHAKEPPVPLLESAGTHCNVCLIPTTMRCTNCHRVYYCSEDHYKTDLKRHNAECVRIQHSMYAFGQSLLKSKPAADSDAVFSDVWHPQNSVSALLLPADAPEPREVKLSWEWIVDADAPGGGYQNIHVKPKWFAEDVAVRNMYIDTLPGENGAIVLPEDRRLALVHDAHFLADGSPVNQCIQKLTNGKAAHKWCGNLLVLRSRATAWKDHDYRDAHPKEDLAVLVQFFKTFGREQEDVSDTETTETVDDTEADDSSPVGGRKANGGHPNGHAKE
ncbi:hypothetical protein K523DRAFT_293894 [Schizophyllum commune Tattone D]|nr:hypothetical protein K523DRAFT_293894 [Schizophyllum commune Tattone D]